MRAAPERSVGSGEGGSYDYRLTLHRVEGLAEADDARFYVVGDAQVDQDHMIFVMIYHSVETCKQLGVATLVHPALEHRELDPGAVSIGCKSRIERFEGVWCGRGTRSTRDGDNVSRAGR